MLDCIRKLSYNHSLFVWECSVAIIRTRVADDTWVFTSELYVEVNAGLVVTPEGGILIDTLPFPSETKQVIDFAVEVTSARNPPPNRIEAVLPASDSGIG